MPGPTDAGWRPGAAGRLIAGLLALVLLAGAAHAQAAPADTRSMAIWDSVVTGAETRIEDPEISTAELDALRARLVQIRGEAQAAAQEVQPNVDDVSRRLKALGPAPKDGETEAPEIAQRRAELNRQLAQAQAPLLDARGLEDEADALVERIDRLIRSRFSAELMSRGPSPLRPVTWIAGLSEIGKAAADYWDRLTTAYSDPVGQRLALNRLPLRLFLVGVGLVILIVLRRWLIARAEAGIATAQSRRATTWGIALRNLVRLIVPAAGLGLIFAAFDPDALVARSGEARLFALPPFVLLLIAAGWLAGSLLAPRHRPLRLVPLDDAEALSAARLVVGIGSIAALALMFSGVAKRWDLTPTGVTVLILPLVLVGSAGLWRVADLVVLGCRRLERTAAQPDGLDGSAGIGLRLLQLLGQFLRVVAVAAPLLGLLGYLNAAGFLAFRSALAIGLLGAGLVVFDLLNRMAHLFHLLPGKPRTQVDGGLTPVVVAAVVGLAGLPLMAMVWGARPADIAEIWRRLRDGVMLGGIQVSAGVVVTFIAVFAIGVALTRLAQALLRGTVLPRTRLDAGGRNAVLAGVGYLGFAVAGLAAVSAAGLDLSSLAIVAGALSVGIGFGLQTIVSNFVSGIILLVERPVKEGDWIEVGGYSGYVKGISVRSTEIQTFDRASVILPNSDLIAGTVLNRTHSGMSGRMEVPVGVAYDSDPRQVEAVLLGIAEEHPLVLEDPAPVVLFMGFGASALNFEVRCWLRDVNFLLSARSDMNFEIAARFRDAGIEIPMPQQDLNIRNVDALAAALRPPAPAAGDPQAPETPQ